MAPDPDERFDLSVLDGMSQVDSIDDLDELSAHSAHSACSHPLPPASPGAISLFAPSGLPSSLDPSDECDRCSLDSEDFLMEADLPPSAAEVLAQAKDSRPSLAEEAHNAYWTSIDAAAAGDDEGIVDLTSVDLPAAGPVEYDRLFIPARSVSELPAP